jgi:hypothetical protein
MICVYPSQTPRNKFGTGRVTAPSILKAEFNEKKLIIKPASLHRCVHCEKYIMKEKKEKIPLFKTWTQWYVFVIAFLVLLIVSFYFLTKYFA